MVRSEHSSSPLQSLLAVVACAVSLSSAAAAETTGTVALNYRSIFKTDAGVHSYPVSVALFPGEGQQRSREQKIALIESGMWPTCCAHFTRWREGHPVVRSADQRRAQLPEPKGPGRA